MTEIIIGSIIGIILGLFFMAALRSFKSPKEGTIQIIKRLEKFYTIIMSVEGYRMNKPGKNFVIKDKDGNNVEKWDIIPAEDKYVKSFSEKYNIYFFLWPLYKTHTYEFSYTKKKKIGEEKEDDHILWQSEDTSEIVVSRSGISNHIKFQVEYPTITDNLLTDTELAKIIIFTNNVIQAVNPYKMLFRIDNWLGIVNETIGADLRGFVADKKIELLNKAKSETEGGGSASFVNIERVNKGGVDETHPGITTFGVKLKKSAFRGFLPGDENCKKLLASFSLNTIATQEGEAVEIAADYKAKAYAKEQQAIVTWKKKYLVDTGLAKVDKDGNITELIPDANTKLTTEAIKELSKLKGTLVLEESGLQKMLNLNK